MSGNFAIVLIQKISDKNKEENFIISPIGIEILLALCSNGAEGETQKEILELLKYKDIEQANSESKNIIEEFRKNEDILKIANAILTKVSAKEKFIKTAIDDYDSKVEELKEFEHVNKWVKAKTNNYIEKIIDSLPPNVLMILLNALYFEAFWKIKFDIRQSYEEKFYNLDNKNKSVMTSMMFLRGTLLNHYENEEVQAVKLNYESNAENINAIIILPKEIEINFFIKYFNTEKYEKLIEGLNKDKIKVNLILPKFKIEYKINLNEDLKDLGIIKAFTNDAEFKKICNKSPIHIGNVLQKNYINVNEEGTQAASINELDIILECYRSKDPDAKDFIVNKPFLFMLRNEKLPKGRDILFFTKICKIEK